MKEILSFDMDGTLVDTSFIDAFWFEGIPSSYAKKRGISRDEAVKRVIKAYDEIGDERLEWYDIKYWFKRFNLDEDWKKVLNRYVSRIKVYEEVPSTLEDLSHDYQLVINSNCPREFLDVELASTKIKHYFTQIFSSTSDFKQIKKTGNYFKKVCEILNISPSQIIHIGDNWKFDVVAPSEIGINTIFLDRENKFSKKTNIISIHRLDEIRNVLKEMFL
jgi:HAD superfamily hydrolase (TIGR01549 family)